MPTEHSKACCETIAAVAGPYQEKGSWTEICGRKTYITGPATSTRGILYLYDVFSFQPQSLQGADILAHSAAHPTLVAMVDWFDGEAVQYDWLTSKDGEGRAKMHAFIETKANPDTVLPAVLDVLGAFRDRFPGVAHWGGVGFCWGAKLVSLLAARGEASPLAVAAQSSPARMDPEEAKRVDVPMAVLASSGEDAKAVKEYSENLEGQKVVETFGDQIHGWMSARGDLENTKVRGQYERGYKILVDFFDKYL